MKYIKKLHENDICYLALKRSLARGKKKKLLLIVRKKKA